MTTTRTSTLTLVLGSLTAFGPLSIDMYLPAFPDIARDFAVPISAVQLSLSAFFIGLMLGQLLYGPLIDRYGRKPPLYFGLALYALASVGCALAGGTVALLIGRFVQALGACAGMVVARAVVRDLFDERDSARIFSLLMLVMGVAPILAPLLGGYITALFGWRALFGLLALLATLCLGAVIFFLPESKGPNPAAALSHAARTYADIAKSRRFLGFALSGAFAQAGMFAYITGSPFVFIRLFGVPQGHYGWLFGANALGLITASQVNVRLLRRFGPERILRTAFLILAVAGASLLFTTYLQRSLVLVWLPIFTFVGTLGITLPNTTAAALATEGARAGSASALLGTLQFAAATLSSMAVSTFDNGTALPMGAVIAVCGLLGLFAYRRTTRVLART